MSESPLNAALRQFEAAEANLEKLERIWAELRGMIPDGIVFGRNPKYEDRCRAYYDVLQAMPKIDGWKPEAYPPDLNDLVQDRLDAQDVGEISAMVSAQEPVETPAREIAEYRHRLNKKRRQFIRKALSEIMARMDEGLKSLCSRYEREPDNEHVEGPDWDSFVANVKEIDTLLGSTLERPSRWSDLNRHTYYAMAHDLRDIQELNWPTVKSGITKQLYDENEPVPVEVEDLGLLAESQPTGPVATKLKWENLTAEQFERLIFELIRSTPGYENPGWLMHTNAPDRGRDLSVMKVVYAPLRKVETGLCRLRVPRMEPGPKTHEIPFLGLWGPDSQETRRGG